MLRLALAFVTPLVLWSASLAAQESEVVGTWTGTFTRGTVKDEFTLRLTQNGQAVTGTMDTKRTEAGVRTRGGAGGSVEGVSVRGTLSGESLSLAIGQRGSMAVTIKDDTMVGSVSRGDGAPFSVVGKRSEK